MSEPKNNHQTDKYLRHAIGRGLSRERIENMRYSLKWFLENTRKPLDKLTADDLDAVLERLEQQPYTAWTKYARKATLKNYLFYLRQTKLGKRIRLRQPPQKLVKSDLITYDELLQVVAQAPAQWQALYMTCYDGAFRRAEILSARVGDLRVHNNYAELSYRQSKTLTGTKTLTLSLPYLLRWKAQHPRWQNKEPLFLTYDRRDGHWTPVSGQTFRLNLHYHADKAGLRKRVYPHLLRHSRATHLIEAKTPLPILEKIGKWVPGSKIVQGYVHLTDEDARDELLRQAGVLEHDPQKDMRLRTCHYCRQPNPPGPERCIHCTQPLDVEKYGQEEKQRQTELDEMYKWYRKHKDEGFKPGNE